MPATRRRDAHGDCGGGPQGTREPVTRRHRGHPAPERARWRGSPLRDQADAEVGERVLPSAARQHRDPPAAEHAGSSPIGPIPPRADPVRAPRWQRISRREAVRRSVASTLCWAVLGASSPRTPDVRWLEMEPERTTPGRVTASPPPRARIPRTPSRCRRPAPPRSISRQPRSPVPHRWPRRAWPRWQ